MTPVGHSLFGATVAMAVIPTMAGRWRTCGIVAVCVAAALIPDYRISGWGHYRYEVSHSVLVNLALMVPLALGAYLVGPLRRLVGGGRVVVGVGAAWLSHLLLDSFYNHGRGVGVLWPVSRWRLTLPIPIFESLQSTSRGIDVHMVRIASVELVAYSAVLLVAMMVRHKLTKPAHAMSTDLWDTGIQL